MTAPRLSRGSRGRFFLYVACLLGTFGLVAIYHNTLTKLDAVKKSNDICQQHQDSLTAQLKVIIDYKSRLEQSLQAEKAEHKQTRTELQKRAENEKLNCDKNTMEANMRYSSLQQQYKILQSNHEDLKKESSRTQKEKLSEINILEAKVKELQEHLKQKERSIEHLKSEYIAVQTEKEKVQKLLGSLQDDQQHNDSKMNRIMKENLDLQKEIDELKENCKSQQMGEHGNADTVQSEHVGDQPGAADLRHDNNVAAEDNNSHVLPQPNYDASNSKKSSTTTTTTPRTNEQRHPQAAQPLAQPTPSKPSTKETFIAHNLNNNNNNNEINVLAPPNFGPEESKKEKKQVPPGVVPPPHQIPEEDRQDNISNDIDKKDENSPVEPNRYRNNILESRAAANNLEESLNNPQKPLRKPSINEHDHNIDIGNQENGAMEVIDSPNNKNIQDDPFNMMENQNEALIGNNQLPDPVAAANQKPPGAQKHPADGLGGGKNLIPRQMPGGLRVAQPIHYDAADGADYDMKPDEKGGDLQLEEVEQEGEEDDADDDYNGQLDARQKDPAVRN